MSASPLRIGTSSWSSDDWRGPFYPAKAKPADYLPFYAQHFDTVECDATFYGIPRASTVEGWRTKTPEGFLFAAKLPQDALPSLAADWNGLTHAVSDLSETEARPVIAEWLRQQAEAVPRRPERIAVRAASEGVRSLLGTLDA